MAYCIVTSTNSYRHSLEIIILLIRLENTSIGDFIIEISRGCYSRAIKAQRRNSWQFGKKIQRYFVFQRYLMVSVIWCQLLSFQHTIAAKCNVTQNEAPMHFTLFTSFIIVDAMTHRSASNKTFQYSRITQKSFWMCRMIELIQIPNFYTFVRRLI